MAIHQWTDDEEPTPFYIPQARRWAMAEESQNAASAPFRAERRRERIKAMFIDGLYYGITVGLLAGFTFWMAA